MVTEPNLRDTKYLVVIDKTSLAAGEPAIVVRKHERSGKILGTFNYLEIDGPVRLVTCEETSVWLLTDAEWKGKVVT